MRKNVQRLVPVMGLLLAASGSALADPCTPGLDLSLGTPGATGSIGKLMYTDFLSPGTKKMLVAGGFTTVGGVANTSGVAVWDGTSFSPLGLGISFSGTAEVNDAEVFGGKLYIGGQFVGSNDGVLSRGLIRWNGSAYEQVNANVDPNIVSIRAIETYKGELYLGGSYTALGTQPGTNVIAKLNAAGNDFLPVGFGFGQAGGNIFDMESFDDGSGEKLYVVGNFTSMSDDFGQGPVPVAGTRWIARWNGTVWESVGGGITSGGGTSFPRDIVVFDDGNGPALYISGGRSTNPTDLTESAVHRWDGSGWKAIPGFHDDPLDTSSTMNVMGLAPTGTGTTLLGQARFAQAGGANARQVLVQLEKGRFKIVPGVNFGTSTVSEIQSFGEGVNQRTMLGGSFTTVNGLAANRLAVLTGCVASCNADFNRSGAIEVQDIFDFLNAWFAGCP